MSTEEKNVVEYRARDGIQVKLTPQIIKRYLVSGKSELVTDQELFMYMGLCKSRGLNPFIKDCYITKFSPGDPAAIITSIDYYRKRARAQKDCKGWRVGIIVQGEKGALEYRNGCILLDGETLIGGWAEATPEGWTVPMRKEVNLKRYIKKTREGVVTRFWSAENQPEQIAKVAESQLLRAVWPDEFQGLYVDSEVQSRNAQEDLDTAVSTATPGDPADMAVVGPAFAEVFSAEISDPMWPAYLKAAAEPYNLTDEEARLEFVKQPEQIKRLFVDWKKRLAANGTAKAADAKVYTAGPGDQHAGTQPPGEPKKDPTFRDEWINLKGPGFSTFVWKNVERFKAASAGDIKEASDKWAKLYPGTKCPFVDAPAHENQNGATGEAQGEAQVGSGGQLPQEGEAPPPGAPPVDQAAAEKIELDRLRAEIAQHDKVHRGYAQQARYDLQMSLASTPMNIDGCRVLIERIETILRERPPGNGGK